jgi:molecular chaperone HtpG
MEKTENFNFDADITQLMNLIVNAFYSKNEIFLRELLSNSSDALEKLRYESLTDKSVLDSENDLKIKLWIDKENKNLIIEDTGIGMTKHDLVHNLGTIARSGTKSFLDQVKKGEIDQIGQFGVGFYSSYLVADKVTLYTKHNSEPEYIWQSTADKSYTISENETPFLKRGTRIVLHIKEDQDEYLDMENVKDVIQKYTQFISFPIELQETREVEVDNKEEETIEVDEEGVDEEGVVEGEEPKVEEVEESKEKRTEIVTEWNVVNKQKPIWCRKPDTVKEEEYQEFYKGFTNDWSNALTYKHFHAEGQLEFDCLLYLPERAPMDMFNQTESKKKNIKLYVKRIFIMDDCDDLVPEWLKFMKGVVDSNDIPLNVSRELLQQNHILRQINKVVVKKSIELFTELAENEEQYLKFYNNYSKMLKLGVHEDRRNRDKLVKLLRFYSSDSPDTYITLDQYIEKMKEGQDNIYFITGQNKQALANSPFIEKLKEDGYNVLYFVDPIDEYMVQSLNDYEDKKLLDVSKEGLKFNEDELKKKNEDNKEFINFLKETLGNRVESVKVSDRLSDTPCVLVASEYGWSANMERIIKSQALRNNDMDQFMGSKRILEINLDHKIIKSLNEKYTDENLKNKCADVTLLMFDTALINSGFMLEKPSSYANKVNRMIELGICDDESEDELSDLEDNDMENMD